MEEQKFVYILSESHIKRVTKLYHISSTYEGAIKAFYDYHLKSHKDFLNENRTWWSLELYGFPMDFDYTNGEINRSEENLSKSSKYRIKFKDWDALKKEYKIINRDLQISNIVD